MIDMRNFAVLKSETMSIFITQLGNQDRQKGSIFWTGPFQVIARLSDLTYEILGHNDRRFVVHVNRLKPCHGTANRESNQIPKWPRKTTARGDKVSSAKRDAVITPPAILSYPLAGNISLHRDSLSATSSPIAPPRPVSTPPSAGDIEDEERLDPTYFPPIPPKQSQLYYGPDHSPVTRSQTRNTFLE